MIITPHLLLGAAIGAKIKNFGWIIVLALLSHALLDKIPHWDYGNKETKRFAESKSYKTLFTFFLKLLIDGLIGLIIVIPVILLKNMIKTERLIFIFFGIFVSLLPDVILGIAKLSYQKFKFSKSYVDFHDKFLHNPKHIKKPTVIGLGAEILISIIAILIILL